MNALDKSIIDCSGVNANKVISQLFIFFILSVSVDKLVLVSVLGGINASLQTFSLFAGFLYSALLLTSANKFSNNINYETLTVLVFLLVIVFCIQAYRSVDIVRSITYLVLLFLNVSVFYIFSRKLDVSSIRYSNKGIFYLGFFIVSLVFVAYLYIVVFQSQMILGDKEKWDIGSRGVYEVLFGRYIAYQGFSGDPNSVGLGVSAVLFCGIYAAKIKNSKLLKFANILLIIVLFASFSRGAIFSLTLTMFFCGFVLRKKEYRYYFYIIIGMLIFGFLITSLMNNPVLEAVNPVSKFGHSVGRRASEWGRLISQWAESPLMGGGLRYDENILGKYAENSYLGVLVNTGVIGLLMFITFISAVYFSALKRWGQNRNDEIFPWIAYGAYLIVSMGYISMEVKPHIWVTLAVLASFSFRKDWLGRRAYTAVESGAPYEG